MKPRILTEADVTFSVRCEPEELAIEGNAMASGDDATDRECYDWIRSELESGNQWAWCCVWTVLRATRDRDSLDWAIEAEDINWEDPELYCSHTGYRIESAYAEPEETELAGSEYE